MAETTPIAVLYLVPRQPQGLDISSLISAGASVLSSLVPEVTSQLSIQISVVSSSATSTSGDDALAFPTSRSTSTGSSGTSSSGSQSTSNSVTSTASASSSRGFQSVTSSSAAAANKSSPTQSNNGSSSKLPIILGVVFGVLALCLLGLLIFCCCRRRRRHSVIFRKRRTPGSLDSDSEVGVEPVIVAKEIETTENHRYPPLAGPYHPSTMRRHSGDPGYAPVGDPFDDTSRTLYDHRSSRRSSLLDPVTEQPERERAASESGIGYTRRWSGSSTNGYSYSPLGVPPRSPHRRSIPRKPVPGADMSGTPGFDFGFPHGNGSPVGGNGGSGRFYDRGRRSWHNGSPY